MRNLIYLKDRILYQVFRVILNISERKHGEKIDNPTIIYVNKIENKIMLKIEKLTAKTMNLYGSTEKKNKSNNGENVPHLEITEVVLVHCNILTRLKSPVNICSKQLIWSFIKFFTSKFCIFENF